MWDKKDWKAQCRIPASCGPDCVSKSTTNIAPVQGGNAMMMPTIAGGKNMCLKPTLACGVYGNPTPNKKDDKDECKVKKTTKQPIVKCPPTQPIKGQSKHFQEASSADLCSFKPKNDPPKCEEKQPSALKEKPRSPSAREICVNVSPIPKSEDVSCCWSLKPLSPLGTSSGKPPSNANICETGQSRQQQSSPMDRCGHPAGKMQSDFNKLGQPIHQTSSKVKPVCPVKTAQKSQLSPCVSSQKEVLTISINCSVSEKTNSMQKPGQKPQEGEEAQLETEECSMECSIEGCVRAEVHTADCIISEKVTSIQECMEEEVQFDDEQEECNKSA